MSLTKKDREQIGKIFEEQIKKLMQQLLADRVIMKNDDDKCQSSKLEQLNKKWREHGIKSETTGLIIAPEDVEIDGKTEFTWDEAVALEREGKIPEGWRLPTRHEWVLIAEEFGQDDNGELNEYRLSKALELVHCDDTSYGYYWSASPYTSSSNSAYGLSFSSSSVNPQYSNTKYYGFSVRCVSL